MDFLKAELGRKRKAMEMAKSSSQVGKIESASKVYLRATDLRRFEEDLNNQQKVENRVAKRNGGETPYQDQFDASVNAANSEIGNSNKGVTKDENNGGASLSSSIPPFDVIAKKLRSLGLPIRIFGETSDAQCYNRYREMKTRLVLSQAEMEGDEFRLGSGHGIRNPFLEKDKEEDKKRIPEIAMALGKKSNVVSYTTTGEASTIAAANASAHRTEGNNSTSGTGNLDDDDDTNDPHKRTYSFFKMLLKQWEDDLSRRPEAIRKSIQGKTETKTFKQCKDYIRPLFKLCKSRKLEISIMNHLLKIISYCEEGEFVKAHDEYMDVSIGRAAWPIGVTMVGIHARSGRAKIESANVAHVMNSELQRKYLTSVKRLMSYAQKKREDVAPSKKVL